MSIISVTGTASFTPHRLEAIKRELEIDLENLLHDFGGFGIVVEVEILDGQESRV